MSKHKFHKGQTVFFLSDPEFYDDELDGEIAKGVITGCFTEDDELYYEINTSDGIYERPAADLYTTLDGAKQVVDDYFAECREHSMECVAQCKEDLHDAMIGLRNLKKRIRHWQSKSKHLQEELEKK